MKQKFNRIILSIVLVIVFLAIIYNFGRIELPFYNLTNQYSGSMYLVGSLKESYNYADAAVIVAFVGGPRFFESEKLIELKSVSKDIDKEWQSASKLITYEFQVKIIKIIDKKTLSINENDVITVIHGYNDFDIDPFFNQGQKNSNQQFVLFISDDTSDSGIFTYSTINQYYVKT